MSPEAPQQIYLQGISSIVLSGYHCRGSPDNRSMPAERLGPGCTNAAIAAGEERYNLSQPYDRVCRGPQVLIEEGAGRVTN